MSPLQLLFSFGLVAACAVALTCNYGAGGLGVTLTNHTCLSNVSACYRMDFDLPNGSVYTSSYDCDTSKICANYTMNANNTLLNGTVVGNLLCCNGELCNVRRTAFSLSVIPSLATLVFISLQG